MFGKSAYFYLVAVQITFKIFKKDLFYNKSLQQIFNIESSTAGIF